jgi:hypothetical protein
MSSHLELLAHLRDCVPEQKELARRLGGDGRVCCYYLCPLSTLRKITKEGIKCRNSVSQSMDLSSPDVQSRRKTVWLGNTDVHGVIQRLRDVPIHSCVNLFWNPLNRTFEAFQRNALLRSRATNDSEDAIVCILELDLEKILNELGVFWTATNRNLASGGFASFDVKQHLFRFPWTKIYAVGPYTQDNPWQARAAEFLVFDATR